MADSSESTLVQNTRKQKEDVDSHASRINRTKLRVSDSLSAHKRTYYIARAAHIAYGRIFGRAHVLPNAYIIGFAKCGTTSLHEYLMQHPDISGGFIKEVHYFDHDKRYMRGTNWYRSNFPLTIQRLIRTRLWHKKMVVIDATPRYINHPHAMRRIKETTPNAKFIVIVRNPIERAYSHYNMNTRPTSWIPEDLSFAEAIRAEHSRINGEYEKMERDEFYYSPEYFGYAYAQKGLYARWLKKWIAEFGDRVLVLDNKLLMTDTQTTLDTATDFLGLQRHKFKDTQRRNVGNYKGNKIDDDTRSHLAKYYREANAELYALLGRDLEWD